MMAKMTLVRSTLTVALIMFFLGEMAQSLPTGDRDELPITESPKVSALRQKLQKLHDILKVYGKTNSSIEKDEDAGSKQSVEVTGSHDAKHDNAHDKDSHHDKKVKDDSAVETHHKARAISAEDMSRRSVEEDDDETDLEQLGAKSKTKRQQNDSIQILAKALAQLRAENPQQETKVPSHAAAKKAKTETHHKDKQDVSSDDPSAVDLESALIDALTKMVEDEEKEEEEKEKEEEKKTDSDDKILPLFHGSDMKALVQDTENALALGGNGNGGSHRQQPSSLGLGGDVAADQGDDDDDDNDDGEVVDVNQDDLAKYLADAGYTMDDLRKEAPLSRTLAIEELEGRLIEDIELANALGISINDLIQDLEDKAFREALIRRLRRLLASR